MSMEQIYHGYTLIDITPTGQILNNLPNGLERNQQRNWETFIQNLSLRTQPTIIETTSSLVDVSNYQFGVNYTGTHKIWEFTFSVDYADIYKLGADIVGLLKSDFKLTPIITGLTETAKFDKSLCYVNGPQSNIYFKLNKYTTG